MAVIRVIEDGATRLEMFRNANKRIAITVGPARGEQIETQVIEVDRNDLIELVKMCRNAMKELE